MAPPRREQFYIASVRLKAFKSVGDTAVEYSALSPRLNAVVGHNGAGKSNLLDAICFAAGCPASILRVRTLAELRCNAATAAQTEVAVEVRSTSDRKAVHKLSAVLTPEGTFHRSDYS